MIMPRVVVNNYYDDYDYYFSSRINRFHRSYTAFDYYAPVFTDSYWYNYQPYSWGVSIYGGGGFGLRITQQATRFIIMDTVITEDIIHILQVHITGATILFITITGIVRL